MACASNPYGQFVPLPCGSQVTGTGGSTNVSVIAGSGNPNTNGTTALPDTLYFNTDGSNTIYTTTDGTTWVQFAGSGGGVTTLSGTGSPNGSKVGSPGWTYTQTDTGSFWVKTSGTTTNTGWLEIVV